jgi:hypothetical protein
MIYKYIFFPLNIIALVSSLSACDNKVNSNTNESDINNVATKAYPYSISDTLQAGKVAENVIINNDPLNSFSIYLPVLYNSNMVWPALFFFDPEGKSAIPINKYKSLADSLGYILIGSNVSKNGQNFEESILIWNTLKNSCFNNISIDKNRIHLAGFSGGARVCCAIASKEPHISGVIANSAGAQQLDQILNQNTLFIGLAGNGDMNRAEMLGIERYLMSTSMTHFYIEYDGKHEWAPIKTMQKALTLASLNSYFKNPSNLNSTLVDNFILKQKNEIEKLKMEGKWIEAYNELLLLTHSAKGLNIPIESLDSLENNLNYIAQKNELLKITAKETEIQQELYKLMLENPNQTIWKTKIEQIRQKSIQKNKVGQMNQRLLGYVSLVCYSLSNRNLVAKNYALAEIMVNCYEIADPENAEVYFFKAIISGAKNDSINTILNLKKSFKLGFTDKKRITIQSEFKFLKDDPAFNEILN